MGKELKNNIRSFRYSDRVAEILEVTEGKTLNEKFENLVITCYATLPEVRHKIEIENRCLNRLKKEWMELTLLKGSVVAKLGCIDRLAAELNDVVARSEDLLSSYADDM